MYTFIRQRTSCAFRKGKARIAMAALAVCVLAPIGASASAPSWDATALENLCVKYLKAGPAATASAAERSKWLDRLTRRIGTELEKSGEGGVPTEDLAMLALFQARMSGSRQGSPESASQSAVPSQSKTSVVGEQKISSAQTPQVAALIANATTGNAGAPQLRMANIEKGQEGIRQAEEQLAKLPLSQRMVITGDLSSVLQGATVPKSTNLATAVCRLRVNFVLRAFSGSKKYGLGNGYFLRAWRLQAGRQTVR